MILLIRIMILLACLFWMRNPEATLFPDKFPIAVEPVVILLLMALQWWSEEVHSKKKTPNPSDIKISRDFLDFYSDDMRYHLSFHDLGGHTPVSIVDRIHSASERWRDSKWRYVDPSLERLFDRVKLRAKILSSDCLANLEASYSGRNYQYSVTKEERLSDFFEPATFDRIRETNQKATDLREACESLYAELKRRHPEVFAR